MARGKTIQVYLMDGKPNERIKCSLANWTGVAYKIPRTTLEQSRKIEVLSQSGVYFLFGTTEESGSEKVYVGQAGLCKNNEGVLHRIFEHKRSSEKDYWTEAVIFTTTNDTFGPTEISYLENRFYQLAKEAKRYEVGNSNEPTVGNVTEEKMSELEEFIDYAKIIMGTLGYRVFEPLVPFSTPTNLIEAPEEDLTLYLNRRSRKHNQTIQARCKQTTEGFVVLKGSNISPIESESAPTKIKELRKKAKIDQNGILLEDYLFKSPSYAASFVIGMSANGRTEWKTKDGLTLNALEKTGEI